MSQNRWCQFCICHRKDKQCNLTLIVPGWMPDRQSLTKCLWNEHFSRWFIAHRHPLPATCQPVCWLARNPPRRIATRASSSGHVLVRIRNVLQLQYWGSSKCCSQSPGADVRFHRNVFDASTGSCSRRRAVENNNQSHFDWKQSLPHHGGTELVNWTVCMVSACVDTWRTHVRKRFPDSITETRLTRLSGRVKTNRQLPSIVIIIITIVQLLMHSRRQRVSSSLHHTNANKPLPGHMAHHRVLASACDDEIGNGQSFTGFEECTHQHKGMQPKRNENGTGDGLKWNANQASSVHNLMLPVWR